MTNYSLVVNPHAGKGKGRRVARELLTLMRLRGIDPEVFETKSEGDGTAAARRAHGDTVVAVGGDGTINEVVNGLIGSGKALGIIPAGSGNDLIKSLGIPPGTSDAFAVLLRDDRRLIDVGCISFPGSGEGHASEQAPVRHFLNGVGIGLDAAVAARINSIPILRGVALYVAAVFQALGTYNSPNFRMELDGTPYTGRWLLVAVGNGRCAGGGFYLTPRAEVDDGLLDLCVVDHRSVPSILRLMPLVLLAKHNERHGLKFLRGKEILLTADSTFYVHADGEVLGRGVSAVRVFLGGDVLRVVVGELFRPRPAK